MLCRLTIFYHSEIASSPYDFSKEHMNKRKSIKSGYILYSPAVWPEEEFQVVVTCIYGQQLNKADEQLWCTEWLEKGMCCVEWLEKGVWINEKV